MSGTNLYCLDANPYNEHYLMNNLKLRNDEIRLNDYLIAYAENMSYIRANSVEIIICTFTLSCVEDIEQVLDEIYRILKPVGFIYFKLMHSYLVILL